MTNLNFTLEDILDAVMLEEFEPSYDALVRWCERYPEQREALADFFATWAVQVELPDEKTVDEQRLANLGVSHALDILHRRDEAKRMQNSSNAQPRLIATALSLGISKEQLATRVGLDDTIIEKLDLRRISSGIPRVCYERLAAALGDFGDLIQTMVTGPPIVALGARHKAKGRPTPTTEDFSDAVRNSCLPDNGKRLWLEAVAAERERDKE